MFRQCQVCQKGFYEDEEFFSHPHTDEEREEKELRDRAILEQKGLLRERSSLTEAGEELERKRESFWAEVDMPRKTQEESHPEPCICFGCEDGFRVRELRASWNRRVLRFQGFSEDAIEEFLAENEIKDGEPWSSPL